MKKENPVVSIIIVNYKVKDELFLCIESLGKSQTKTFYEIIVIDNDETKTIEKELKIKFPRVIYIKSKTNNGFGAGNNLGVKYAKGEYFFFLNPDTIVEKGAIDILVNFLKKHPKAGIAAPLLLDSKNHAYPLQGTRKLTPLNAIFSLSILQKFWPRNPFFENYYLFEWDKRETKEVDVVPGTAFIIKRNIFEDIGGFDENFFLYFEESDLCKRVKENGSSIFMVPPSQVLHSWGESTKRSTKNIRSIFEKSREYYFKKHYGTVIGQFTNWILSISKEDILLFAIFTFGVFLRFYKLKENFYFDAEIGDNLLDIKNAYIHHTIPLLGPPTSHPWLYFGPLFYWIYEPFWIISKFNPISYGFFGAFFASFIPLINYTVIKRLFNKKVALISSFFIVFSPLFLDFAKWARFFSLIPLITPLFLLWVTKSNKNTLFLFLAGIALGIMFNFHYTPLMIIPAVISYFILKRMTLVLKKSLLFICGFLIPMIPFFVYDGMHKFTMTLNLLLWIPYRILGFLGIYHKNTLTVQVIKENALSYNQFFSSIFIDPRIQIGTPIALILFIYMAVKIYLMKKRNTFDWNFILISLWGMWGIIAVFVHGSPPPHYFVPILGFPLIIGSLFLTDIWKKQVLGKALVLLILITIALLNLKYLFSTSWFYAYKLDPFSYQSRVKTAQAIIANVQGEKYSLKRVGYNDQFSYNYAQNYMYLLWYFGNEPVNKSTILYTIYELSGNQNKAPNTLSKSETAFSITPNIVIIRKNQ